MKKLIAIGVVFVLVAGAAFAAVEVGGEVNTRITFAKGTSEKYVDGDGDTVGYPVMGDGKSWDTTFGAATQNDEGTFGAWVRFRAGSFGGGVSAWGAAWWKPFDALKIQIGQNPDGEFELSGFSRWGFYEAAIDYVDQAANAWGGNKTFDGYICMSNSFYGGYGKGGLLLSLNAGGLAVNVGIPFFGANTGKKDAAGDPIYSNYLEVLYRNVVAQIKYDIANVGTIGFTYAGENDVGTEAHSMFFYFGLTAVANLGFDLGVGYKLPTVTKTATAITTDYEPLFIGVDVKYNADKFGIKLRAQLGVGGKTVIEPIGLKTETPKPFTMLVDILPSYAVADSATIFLAAGLAIQGGSDTVDYKLGWSVQPYVQIKGGPANFWLGFRLEHLGNKDDKDDPIILWSIPLGIKFSF